MGKGWGALNPTGSLAEASASITADGKQRKVRTHLIDVVAITDGISFSAFTSAAVTTAAAAVAI